MFGLVVIELNIHVDGPATKAYEKKIYYNSSSYIDDNLLGG